MAICPLCEKEMIGSITCDQKHVIIKGKAYLRSTYHFGEVGEICHDCGIVNGRIHHEGCDVERCPKCGEQQIGCGCLDEEIYTTPSPADEVEINEDLDEDGDDDPYL